MPRQAAADRARRSRRLPRHRDDRPLVVRAPRRQCWRRLRHGIRHRCRRAPTRTLDILQISCGRSRRCSRPRRRSDSPHSRYGAHSHQLRHAPEGADGAVIPTVNDGNVTLFIVAEHWNAEGLGWHVAKHGNRYAGAEALALAVGQVFGSVRADAAREVLLRHDHGSPFMSEHFQNQLRFFGMAPSFAFVREPETNGVAERFIRTLTGLTSRTSRRSAPPSGRTSIATTSTGSWKSTATEAPPQQGAAGWPQPSPPTRPHNAALCPKNRVRYKRQTFFCLNGSPRPSGGSVNSAAGEGDASEPTLCGDPFCLYMNNSYAEARFRTLLSSNACGFFYPKWRFFVLRLRTGEAGRERGDLQCASWPCC